MANTKVSALSTITTPADDDLIYLVDATGTTSVACSLANFVLNYVNSEAAIDHGSTTGLTDDDHSIYAHLTGRSLGQTLTGGTAANEDLKFVSTSNSTKGTVIVDASGTTPTSDGTFHVHTSTAGSITASTNGDDVVVEVGAEGGISILTPSASKANILFGNPTNGNADGRVVYDTPNRAMQLWTAGAQRVTIDSSGNVGIAQTSPTSGLHLGGSFSYSRTASAANFQTSGEVINAITNTAAARTVTIATSDTVANRVIVVSDESGGAGTNNITVATQASELINGGATATISANYGALVLYSDGTDWFIIGKTF